MADVKRITGEFTGAYAKNPFTNKYIPIWVGDYVLAGYGTGAVMAVPGHDSRDYAFANYFKKSFPELEPKEVVLGGDITKEAYESYDGILVNSDFINGMKVPEAKKAVIKKVEELGIGYGKTNYRLRDAIFSRQRYWGEPFPIYYKDGIPYAMDERKVILLKPAPCLALQEAARITCVTWIRKMQMNLFQKMQIIIGKMLTSTLAEQSTLQDI